jgi:hypothetical protein
MRRQIEIDDSGTSALSPREHADPDLADAARSLDSISLLGILHDLVLNFEEHAVIESEIVPIPIEGAIMDKGSVHIDSLDELKIPYWIGYVNILFHSDPSLPLPRRIGHPAKRMARIDPGSA